MVVIFSFDKTLSILVTTSFSVSEDTKKVDEEKNI